MNRGLLLKAVRELVPPTLLLGLAIMVVEIVLAYVLPTLQRQIPTQMLQIPFVRTILQAILGAQLSGPIGPDILSAICWVHPVVLALLAAHAIISCTRVPAGEVDRGTIDVLLSLPVSRTGLFVSDTAVWMLSGLVMLGLALVGNAIGATWALAPELRPSAPKLAYIALNLLSLYFAAGGLAWLASALSDRRGWAMGVVFAILLASFLINFLAEFWTPAKQVSFLSVLTYYRPLYILRDGTPRWSDIAILAGAGGALWAAAGVVFHRRDLSTL